MEVEEGDRRVGQGVGGRGEEGEGGGGGTEEKETFGEMLSICSPHVCPMNAECFLLMIDILAVGNLAKYLNIL